MKILFSGGGTLGSVTPLLAMKESIEEEFDDVEFVWVGTPNGPEEGLVSREDIRFYSISSGKLRRYLSLKNFTDFFKFIIGLFQSFNILRKEKPDICITTGGFVSVPVHMIAWVLDIKSWVHQQDVQPGLANKIMAKFASKVTTATEKSLKHFSKEKTECIGNPVRKDIYEGSAERARKLFNLERNKPVIFALGGGTGAKEINQLVTDNIEDLASNVQIIHITGPERDDSVAKKLEKQYKDYHAYTFLDEEIKHAYAAADLVVCRAGFGTLTELVALEKPAILIPKKGHQQRNAELFQDSNNIKVYRSDKDFIEVVKRIFKNSYKLEQKNIFPIVKAGKVKDILNKIII